MTQRRHLLHLSALLTLFTSVVIVNYIFDLKMTKNYNPIRIFRMVEQQRPFESLPLCEPYNHSMAPKGAPTVVQPLGPCDYCRDRHKTDGRFYNFTTDRLRFYVYSAFYDDRPSLLGRPLIRLVSISDGLGHLRARNDTMYCVLHHSGGLKRVEMRLDARVCGPDYTFNGPHAGAFVFNCPTGGVVPHSVSVVRHTGGIVTSCMPVEFPTKLREKKDIAVCVPVSYGSLNPYRIIEWVEVQKLMGVDSIAVYDMYTHQRALSVLKHYEEEGIVRLRKMQLVYPHERHLHLNELATALNDCLYRHMNAYKRIMVSDFDEFVKPLKHNSIQGLIDHLEKTVNRSMNYIIRNSYFFLSHKPDANISSHYTILRYRKRAPVSPMWHRVKPIILTSACTEMYSHLCLGATPEFAKMKLEESIDPDLAQVYHYRHCPGGVDCARSANLSVIDDSMLMYKDFLTAKVKEKVLTILNETIA